MEYEINSFFWQTWDPQESVRVARAELEVVEEKPFDFDTKNIGAVSGPEISTDAKGRKRALWQARDVPAFEREYRYAPEDGMQVGVTFVSRRFNLGGYAGSNDSWKSLGGWFRALSHDRLAFDRPMPSFEKYRQIADPKERVRQIYRFLQEKTRYVQIYLGVDGWRPHDVKSIDAAKYGDCKDLSVYMVAMLEQAGIQAYQALALTRDKGWVDPAEPKGNFNHCITVVPTADDTLWLECTSDYSAYNDPPASIEGVNVLLVKPDGGALVRTPVSPAAANRSKLLAEARLLEDRTLEIEGSLSFTGNLAIDTRWILSRKNTRERREWLAQKIADKSGSATCGVLQITGLDNPDTTLVVRFAARVDYFARKAGRRYVVRPRLYHRVLFSGEEPEERTMALLNLTRFVQEDEVEFTIPENWRPRRASAKDSLDSPFGKFSYELTPAGNKLLWKSSFISNARKVSLEDYHDYFKFMTAAKKISDRKLVLENRRS